ncbi:MAG: 16S rRNA (adenine(1518)-N(6)/adenine(1519)-N(6))-dimethyltransferase RsmA [Endomicrobia bacterium]|nr:16S rRNA (adenine(1518)-N(6)/adenine(1519)-N(6))-dimethyltransferase RsmA [Endomicrobiia bacterium]MDW8055737.1 16S rRNA (adenine(1518)-N(6)/adenine(1519)-N(6))-dimethyltransferase RsmA [Elusimicrobiota bacterium]
MKNLGQHFLVDEDTSKKIVDSLELTLDDTIVEIGGGKGALTKKIVQNVKKLYVVEIDKNLCNFLQQKFKEFGNIEIINDDFLNVNLSDFFKGEKLKVVGNIPYSITSKILKKLYEDINFWKMCVLMLQYEVGQKLLATPTSKKFSQLTLLTNFYTKAELLFKVDKNYFVPQPQVDSCVVKFLPNEQFVEYLYKDELFRLISCVFKHKRKTLINSLNSELKIQKDIIKNIVSNLGIKPTARPQDISLQNYIKLVEKLSKYTKLSTT